MLNTKIFPKCDNPAQINQAYIDEKIFDLRDQKASIGIIPITDSHGNSGHIMVDIRTKPPTVYTHGILAESFNTPENQNRHLTFTVLAEPLPPKEKAPKVLSAKKLKKRFALSGSGLADKSLAAPLTALHTHTKKTPLLVHRYITGKPDPYALHVSFNPTKHKIGDGNTISETARCLLGHCFEVRGVTEWGGIDFGSKGARKRARLAAERTRNFLKTRNRFNLLSAEGPHRIFTQGGSRGGGQCTRYANYLYHINSTILIDEALLDPVLGTGSKRDMDASKIPSNVRKRFVIIATQEKGRGYNIQGFERTWPVSPETLQETFFHTPGAHSDAMGNTYAPHKETLTRFYLYLQCDIYKKCQIPLIRFPRLIFKAQNKKQVAELISKGYIKIQQNGKTLYAKDWEPPKSEDLPQLYEDLKTIREDFDSGKHKRSWFKRLIRGGTKVRGDRLIYEEGNIYGQLYDFFINQTEKEFFKDEFPNIYARIFDGNKINGIPTEQQQATSAIKCELNKIKGWCPAYYERFVKCIFPKTETLDIGAYATKIAATPIKKSCDTGNIYKNLTNIHREVAKMVFYPKQSQRRTTLQKVKYAFSLKWILLFWRGKSIHDVRRESSKTFQQACDMSPDKQNMAKTFLSISTTSRNRGFSQMIDHFKDPKKNVTKKRKHFEAPPKKTT